MFVHFSMGRNQHLQQDTKKRYQLLYHYQHYQHYHNYNYYHHYHHCQQYEISLLHSHPPLAIVVAVSQVLYTVSNPVHPPNPNKESTHSTVAARQ
jgi:3-polyprenyl-4-hydroxybenzoate decarboxylase